MTRMDCCVTHPGITHVEHNDRLWEQRNRSLLVKPGQFALMAFMREESARLDDKIQAMERHEWPDVGSRTLKPLPWSDAKREGLIIAATYVVGCDKERVSEHLGKLGFTVTWKQTAEALSA